MKNITEKITQLISKCSQGDFGAFFFFFLDYFFLAFSKFSFIYQHVLFFRLLLTHILGMKKDCLLCKTTYVYITIL